MSTYLAFDFGAESGRAVLVNLTAGKATINTLHRFPNRPVRLANTLYWDFPFLFAEIIEALKLAAQQGITVKGIGVDTWGVDFGLLGPDDRLLATPVHYRDTRTENIHQYSNRFMSNQQIFIETGTEPWAISSLFQLLAMKKEDSPLLKIAKTFLNMPDLFNFFLTGVKACEKSITSTSNLMSTTGTWAENVIKTFSLPDIFGKLIEPATVLGPLCDHITSKTGLKNTSVIATCGHDTAAVAASIPATDRNWAFLSCGTWSILGRCSLKPIATPEALNKGFSNEYTLGGWFTCRNIIGLWLVQELKRKWDSTTDPWDYDRMTKEAANSAFDGIIDVSAPSLMAPADMEKALIDLLARLDQPKPSSRGRLVRCVLKSLALEYAFRLAILSELTGTTTDTLYLVGGGTANRLLCQFTANACGITVQAGIDQCTSMGNGLTQALALGEIASPLEIRKIMRNSFQLTAYGSEDKSAWSKQLQAYSEIQKNRPS